MDVSMKTDSPALVVVADAASLQDVWMVDNDSKTFLYLRSQGLTVETKDQTIND